jgi:hypothetical protein
VHGFTHSPGSLIPVSTHHSVDPFPADVCSNGETPTGAYTSRGTNWLEAPARAGALGVHDGPLHAKGGETPLSVDTVQCTARPRDALAAVDIEASTRTATRAATPTPANPQPPLLHGLLCLPMASIQTSRVGLGSRFCPCVCMEGSANLCSR